MFYTNFINILCIFYTKKLAAELGCPLPAFFSSVFLGIFTEFAAVFGAYAYLFYPYRVRMPKGFRFFAGASYVPAAFFCYGRLISFPSCITLWC